MKTGEAARALGVDIGTVKNWIDHEALSRFFSDGAKGEHGGTQRVLSEEDVLILNTIRELRSNGISEWERISERLDSGHRFQEFPQNAISADPRLIPVPQAEQAARYLATVAERDAALARVDVLENEIEKMRQELAQKGAEIAALREKHLEDRLSDQKASNDEVRRLERELQEQRMKDQREIGKLQAQVEMLRELVDGKRSE